VDWFYAENGRQIGPVQDDALQALVRAGTVTGDTLVWHAGLANWQTWSSLGTSSAAPLVTASGVPGNFCTECGRAFSPEDLMQFGSSSICAECKPLFSQRLRETGGVGATMIYGGFWIRFAARIIDGLLLWAVSMALFLPFSGTLGSEQLATILMVQGTLILVQLGLSCAYEAILTVRMGGTLGKLALGLQVVTPDGQRLTMGRSIGRYFALLINSFTFLIGYIIAAFDDQKRGLHDHICGTRVIRKRA